MSRLAQFRRPFDRSFDKLQAYGELSVVADNLPLCQHRCPVSWFENLNL